MKFKYWRLLCAAVSASVCLVSSAFAENASSPRVFVLSWAASTQNDDGTPVTDLIGYYVYHGASPDTLQPHYFSSATKPWILLSFPPGGTHYFAVTAINADGIESTLAPVVNTTML